MMKFIYISTEGIENYLLSVIWQVVVTAVRTGRDMGVVSLTYPVRSAEVLAIMPVMVIGVGEDVERKLLQRIV